MRKDFKSEEEPAGSEAEKVSRSRVPNFGKVGPEPTTGAPPPDDQTLPVSGGCEVAAEPSTPRLTTHQGSTIPDVANTASRDRTSVQKRDNKRVERSSVANDRLSRRSRISTKTTAKSKRRSLGRASSPPPSEPERLPEPPPELPLGPLPELKASTLAESGDDPPKPTIRAVLPKPAASVSPGPVAGSGVAKPKVGGRRQSIKPTSAEVETLTRRTYKDVAAILRSPVKEVTVDNDDAVHKRKIVAFVSTAVAVVVILLVVGLVAAIALRRVKRLTFCETSGCLVHAKLLTESLNTSIDPCEDFSAYVCSAWKRSGEYSEHVKSPVDGILFARFISFKEMLATGTHKLPAGKKALAMYDSCRGPQAEGEQGLVDFKQLMRSMGLSWPEPPEENANALGVLLTLSYKWQILFWLSLSVPTGQSSVPWRLDIMPGDYLPLLLNQHKSVVSVGGYADYWNGYYQAFHDDIKAVTDKRDIEAIAEAEGHILEQLYNSLFSKKKNPAIFTLGDLGTFTASVSSATWQDQINEQLHFTPKVDFHDVVLARDTGYLSVLGSLFGNYTDRQLISHLSWLFVQVYAPLFYPKLQLVRYGDKWKEELYRPIACAFQVESSFKMLVFALEFITRFTRDDEKLVLTYLDSLTAAAVRKLKSSDWLDEESQELAAEKMKSLHTLLFPPHDLISNDLLERLYRDFPGEEVSFRDYWLDARLAISNDSRTPELEATLRLPTNFPPPVFGYNYVLNVVEVPIGIVNRPLYYSDGTNAMFYGGLGFFLALEMVRALDSVGLRWHNGGWNRTSLYSSATAGSFEAKDSCLQDEGIESVFPEVPAVEVAYDALVNALKSGDAKPGLQGLSEEKVFFMTLCYMSCLTPDARNLFSANCHKVVRNSPAFHEAFNCPSGSKMNPAEKCGFFD